MSGLRSDNLNPRQMVATAGRGLGPRLPEEGVGAPAELNEAVDEVRRLEHVLFEGEQKRGGADEGTVAEINQLRHALGWLEVDADGQWRWPSRPTS